jgi:hypothetical protein
MKSSIPFRLWSRLRAVDAKRARQRRRRRAVAVQIESIEPRLLLSAASSAWMSSQPDSIPLTNISVPGTYESASGPSLQDALLGSGSSNIVNPPTLTNNATNNAALAAETAASLAAAAALAAGGENLALNAAAVAADVAVLQRIRRPASPRRARAPVWQ